MFPQRVLCRATVDEVKPAPIIGGLATFRVECWGIEPFDFVRIYEISAKNDNMAAQEGIRRFVEEMEARQTSED